MVLDGWMDGWMDVKAVLRIAYSNQKHNFLTPTILCPKFAHLCVCRVLRYKYQAKARFTQVTVVSIGIIQVAFDSFLPTGAYFDQHPLLCLCHNHLFRKRGTANEWSM